MYEYPIGKTSKNRLSLILNRHYRRVQQCYAEIVDMIFPTLASKLPYYQILPIRYHLHIDEIQIRSGRLYMDWKYIPVENYEYAGAKVDFSASEGEFSSESQFVKHAAHIDSELAKFRRHAPDCQYMVGRGSLPDFCGREVMHRELYHESAIIRSAFKKLAQDLDFVFRHLPPSYQARFQ